MNTDLSIKELAREVHRHPEYLRHLARTGKLDGAYKVGHTWLVNRETIETLRAGGAVPE